MKNKNEIKDWISHFAFFKKLTALSFVKKIVLYGSRARKDNQERSDIDLAITCPEATLYDWVTIREIIDDADTLLHIDCIRFDSLRESDFKNNILKDGIMLYEKKDYKMDIITQKLLFLEKALTNLKIMLDEPVHAKRAEIDSCIQRFEYTFELCWKTMQIIFAAKGQQLYYPKDILKYAYKTNIIQDDQLWLSMLADRNESSHIYNVEVADRIYVSIKTDYFPELEKTILYLKNTFSIKE